MAINFPTFVTSETPGGSINGTNRTFTVANLPYEDVDLYWNGLLQVYGVNYTLSGTTLTLAVAPSTGDVLLVDYLINNGTSTTPTCLFVDAQVPSGTLNGSNVTFTLGSTPITSSLKLYKNGVRQFPSIDYTISGATITFSSAPQAIDFLSAFYRIAGTVDKVFTFELSQPLLGPQDGSNSLFFLPSIPNPGGSLQIYYNGVMISSPTQYALILDSVRWAAFPPGSEDYLVANYRVEAQPTPTYPTYSFPVLSTGSVAMYPATLSNSFSTRVLRFVSDQEQRFTARAQIFYAVLEYHNISGYDMSIIQGFFNQQMGRFAVVNVKNPEESTTFSITIDGETYENCCFDQDTLGPVLSRGEDYSFQLAIKQLVSVPNTRSF